MEPITTLLIDDEERSRNVIRELLSKYFPQVKISGECDRAEDAKIKINALQPQLLFLDISMPLKNAFELLQEVSEKNFEIIFITAHSNYSLQAFRYSAIDYLLKPVQDDLFINAVQKAIARITEKNQNKRLETLLHNFSIERTNPDNMRICIPSVKGFSVVQVRDIIYLEAESSYTIFHLFDGKKITASKTLSEYEEIIDTPAFLRIHKSYLVNLNFIKEYIKGEGGHVILTNGQEIEVSRRKKDQFLKRISDFFGHSK